MLSPSPDARTAAWVRIGGRVQQAGRFRAEIRREPLWTDRLTEPGEGSRDAAQWLSWVDVEIEFAVPPSAVGDPTLTEGKADLVVIRVGDELFYVPAADRSHEVRLEPVASPSQTVGMRVRRSLISMGPWTQVPAAGWKRGDDPFDATCLAGMTDDALDRGLDEAPYRKALALILRAAPE